MPSLIRISVPLVLWASQTVLSAALHAPQTADIAGVINGAYTTPRTTSKSSTKTSSTTTTSGTTTSSSPSSPTCAVGGQCGGINVSSGEAFQGCSICPGSTVCVYQDISMSQCLLPDQGAVGCATIYTPKCGGVGWSGCVGCVAGLTCVYSGDPYFAECQCLNKTAPACTPYSWP